LERESAAPEKRGQELKGKGCSSGSTEGVGVNNEKAKESLSAEPGRGGADSLWGQLIEHRKREKKRTNREGREACLRKGSEIGKATFEAYTHAIVDGRRDKGFGQGGQRVENVCQRHR